MTFYIRFVPNLTFVESTGPWTSSRRAVPHRLPSCAPIRINETIGLASLIVEGFLSEALGLEGVFAEVTVFEKVDVVQFRNKKPMNMFLQVAS